MGHNHTCSSEIGNAIMLYLGVILAKPYKKIVPENQEFIKKVHAYLKQCD